VYFIRALANKVVHVNAGLLTHYAGDYQYYLDKTKSLSARAALTAGTKPIDARNPSPGLVATLSPSDGERDGVRGGLSRKEQKRLEAEARQARSNKLRGQRQIVHDFEKQIQALEKRQAEITAELEKPEIYQAGGKASQLNREFSHNADELTEITPKWEAAATKLAAMEAES